ncbi:MAG: transporter [Clostridiales bacterium]|jgi:putative tricarboxylic transport membrane protein|nr:transporter [Clostridiales bacterium]
MDSLFSLFQGFSIASSGLNILYCLLGVTVGMLVGVLPGLGPVTATALLLPITYKLDSIPAIIMLSGIYYGSMYGGTITSVLINVPGEGASVVTCFDGHEMAKQGRAGTALGVAGIGSFIGGTISIIGLTLIGPPLASFALKFGPPEFFAIMFFGLVLVVGLMGKSLIRGLIAAVFGLTLSMIGMDPVSGVVRFTFGQPHLMDGLDFVTIAMGLFGISDILLGYEEAHKKNTITKLGKLLPEKHEIPNTLKAIGRGTGLGFITGLIPGANSVIPTVLSYAIEKKLAKDPTRFGKGAVEGVAGPETANNAYCGAALIPLFTLGIPTSPAIAVLFGAFVMHGLTPGPMLFQQNPDLVWAVIASMFIGNLILLIFNLPLVGMWGKVALIPPKIMYPAIAVISALGAYAVSGSVWHVTVMTIFGVIGYFLKKLDIPMAPIVLTFVLGKLLENSLLQSLIYFKGNMLGFFKRPISGTVLAISIILLIGSILSVVMDKRKVLAEDIEA